MFSFGLICENIADWHVVRNINGVCAYSENQWVSYDDDLSVEKKVNLIRKYNLDGASIWSRQDHDFKGRCDGEIFVLLSKINKGCISNKRLQGKDDNDDVTLDDLFPKEWRCFEMFSSISQSDSF